MDRQTADLQPDEYLIIMSQPHHIVVCAGIVPDPLQTLEPIQGPSGPALKNEMMLPSVLDPWAWHALFEAANLAKANPQSKVWLVCLGPKAKLQQVMMGVAQKAPFELVVCDGPSSGFADAGETAGHLAKAIGSIAGLDRSRLLLFGGWQSASRGTGAVLQMVGELLGIQEQFQGLDSLKVAEDGSMTILERVPGGAYLESVCSELPVAIGWATGSLPEPPNNPQIGMLNMRGMMPALQKAAPAPLSGGNLSYKSVEIPRQQRETRIVKDVPAEEIAKEIVEWLKG